LQGERQEKVLFTTGNFLGREEEGRCPGAVAMGRKEADAPHRSPKGSINKEKSSSGEGTTKRGLARLFTKGLRRKKKLTTTEGVCRSRGSMVNRRAASKLSDAKKATRKRAAFWGRRRSLSPTRTAERPGEGRKLGSTGEGGKGLRGPEGVATGGVANGLAENASTSLPGGGDCGTGKGAWNVDEDPGDGCQGTRKGSLTGSGKGGQDRQEPNSLKTDTGGTPVGSGRRNVSVKGELEGRGTETLWRIVEFLSKKKRAFLAGKKRERRFQSKKRKPGPWRWDIRRRRGHVVGEGPISTK